jgi:polygalacturonase
MTRILPFLIVFLLPAVLPSCTDGDRWKMAAEIEQSIILTSFPPDTFNIADFGAVAGDTSILSTRAIEAAIMSCHSGGGGVVYIPAGTWLTGPITLMSNVNLHITENAALLFTTEYEQYLPPVQTRWEGMDCYNFHPLIYAIDATNIALTGKGIIDGQASNEAWWWMNGNPNYGWKEGMNNQKLSGRKQLLAFEQNQTPAEERRFGLEGALRPQLVNFNNCNTVLIEDLTLKNSPFWVIHPVRTDNFIMRGVTIVSAGPNSDGCDPESCNGVLIEDCYFDTGDDCIAIKSGRNNDGRRWSIPSQNIIVRNCRMADGHGGVVIGSEISGGFSNLFVEDCEMDSPELLRVIRIKTSDCRGGVIENVNVRNVTVGKCSEAVLKINLMYEPGEECNRSFPPFVRDVTLDNVTSRESKYGIYIIGLDGEVNISGITLSNCSFNGVQEGASVTGAEGVKLKKVFINGKKLKI